MSGRIVKTPVSPLGRIELKSSTGLGSLMAIGALYHTAKQEKDCFKSLPTDKDGLKILSSDTATAINSIMESVEALGKILVYADTGEIGKRNFDALGWLLVSLGEIGGQLQDVRQVIEDNAMQR